MESGQDQQPNRTTWTILIIREHVQTRQGRDIAWTFECHEHRDPVRAAAYPNPYLMWIALEAHLLGHGDG